MYDIAWQRLAIDAQVLTDGRPLRDVTKQMSKHAISHLQQGTHRDARSHNKWITQNKIWLREHYHEDSLAWLYAWRFLVGECDLKVPKSYQVHPWAEWYFTILGSPPRAYPFKSGAWLVTLHHVYLRWMREWRGDFEGLFLDKHPGHEFASGQESWKDWHHHGVMYGLDALWDDWTQDETEHYLLLAGD